MARHGGLRAWARPSRAGARHGRRARGAEARQGRAGRDAPGRGRCAPGHGAAGRRHRDPASPELASNSVQPWTARLRYAYADALLAATREDEAREWFAKALEADKDGSTDASDRLAELDGVDFVDAMVEDDEDGDLDAPRAEVEPDFDDEGEGRDDFEGDSTDVVRAAGDRRRRPRRARARRGEPQHPVRRVDRLRRGGRVGSDGRGREARLTAVGV
ncbi:hypothetical protein LSPH26S_04756 [Lysinibacillus sphaericus]